MGLFSNLFKRGGDGSEAEDTNDAKSPDAATETPNDENSGVGARDG